MLLISLSLLFIYLHELFYDTSSLCTYCMGCISILINT